MKYFGLACSALVLIACGGDPTPDAGGDMILGCGVDRAFPELRWDTDSTGMEVGAERVVGLRFLRDCNSGTELTLTTSVEGVVTIPNAFTIAPDRDAVSVPIGGISEGTVVVTASATHESGDSRTAELEVVVGPITIPTCDGSGGGTLSPGGDVAASGGTLTGAAIALPEGAARDDAYHVDPFDVTIECAPDIVPGGYRALGPAVTFGPVSTRLAREVPLTIPIRMAALPIGANRGHVEVSYQPPHDLAPRVVGIASPRFSGSAGAGVMIFEVPRLGTYQAVVREDAPTRRERTFSFRGILGFSMGGSGAGRVGFGNPEIFDFVAPLGGPTDWTFMLEHVRNNHLGGFCTEAERLVDPTGCAEGASLARVPPPTRLHEHAQHFEHWWYEDGFDGQGGTFDRDSYIDIFRDLATMFGNPNYDRTEDPSQPDITPPGVPDSRRSLSNGERCAVGAEVVIPPYDGTDDTGFFDDEFNPEGLYPVITFCDGAEIDGDVGLWNPDGAQNTPMEILLAVDLDGDGRRDLGEPVIRNGREPYDDFGLDRTPNELEVGADGSAYDAETNRDPAGDDFDFQYNPTGTENNWQRDTPDGDPCNAEGEAFVDAGLDGLMGTAQLGAGGFDAGEGNGCFDRSRGAERMINSSPRALANGMTDAVLDDVDLFADGGIRDLFNWAVMGNMSTAGFASRGRSVRFYNGHHTLHMQDGRADFDYLDVPWTELGRAVMVRYGSPDEEPRFIVAGDGGHVGTGEQLINRLRSGLLAMDARWPDGNRERVIEDRVCAEGDRENCGYVNSFVFEFTASTGRSGPVSMVLPPGYFFEENQGMSYPVVYFLHGYGMSPEDLVALGLLMFADMNTPRVGSSRRMQKIILVFPDGRCRNGECLRGTFYTDAPDNVPGGAQMQTFLLDLMDHIDAEYRTRSSETFEVVE